MAQKMSHEHMKEYAHFSPSMLKQHMQQEKELLNDKEKKEKGQK